MADPRSWRRWRRIKIWIFENLRKVVVPTLALLIGFRIEGLEHVPRSGGALVVSNHLHNADPILLVAAYPRPLLWMAKKEVFGVPVISWIARQAGAFPVDRGTADRGALRQAEGLLDEGLLVGVFPEGTRSTTGGIKSVYPGVALIALRSGVPILPTAIFGTEVLPFNGHKGRRRGRGRPRVTVRIGRPFELPPRRAGEHRSDLASLTDLMMVEVARLLPESYRGLYAERCATVDVPGLAAPDSTVPAVEGQKAVTVADESAGADHGSARASREISDR
ncbi:MAG TPA: lysophospholipid acyltransferase family protein [Thermomicrobiaceae bacterium]|nr:lysophospholipid acyltransferase family protein [Thermomicrobiaceae bacterium]